jgi:hypothetical protein
MAVGEELRFSGDYGYSDFSAWRAAAGERHGPFIGRSKAVRSRQGDKLLWR